MKKTLLLVVRSLWFASCAAIVLGSAGCGQDAPASTAEATQATGSGSGSGSEEKPDLNDGDRATQVRLSAAIECLNRHSGRVFKARDGYLGTVDRATGATEANKKPMLLGLYGIDACRRETRKASALEPAVARLDEAAAAYVGALEQLAPAYEALTGYYRKGEHLDDHGKQLATLHPEVMAAFEAFANAHRRLDDEVRAVNRERRERKLAAREQAEGRNLEVIIDTMMLEAETLIGLLAAETVNAATLDAAIAAYGKLVDEVGAYASAHQDEVKRGSMTNLRNYSQGFLAAGKVVARARRDGGQPSEGERAKAFEQYNSLVKNYNSY